MYVSEKCGLDCGGQGFGKPDTACYECICEKPWYGPICGMYFWIWMPSV